MTSIVRSGGRFLLDVVGALLSYPLGVWTRWMRAAGVEHLPFTRAALERVGVFPIRRHYYEPLFHPDDLRHDLGVCRELPGIDFRRESQLVLLRSFDYEAELVELPVSKSEGDDFYYSNGMFEAGDAELWYSMIRHFRPRKIVEVGGGMSTRLAKIALEANSQTDTEYACRHVCIEPYEVPSLERCGVEVIRRRVEEVDLTLFDELGRDDILFIDSSHIIRPQGDVLFLFLEVIPRLRAGVVIHVHDVFSPRDYRAEWVVEQKRFWNEQYLLEALLSGGERVEVLLAANYLAHEEPDALAARAPIFRSRRGSAEPGSIYLRRTEA